VGSGNSIRLVARTGTVVPGVGEIAHIQNFLAGGNDPTGGALINNRGQVFFETILADGAVVLLVATPRG
jgi:hypothetical protein